MDFESLLIPKLFSSIKPPGPSSFGHVSWVKRRVKPKGKFGHFGTLDPFASGVLVMGIDGAMRFNQYLQDEFEKSYLAIGKIGIKTDSGDKEGKPVNESSRIPTKNEFLSALSEFKGEYLQSPPYYSAVKYNGRPLYEYARKGEFIDRPAVKRHVYNLELISLRANYIVFKASVSKGTYIRKLFEDICESLGVCGHLHGLIRDEVGPFNLKTSMTKYHIDNIGSYIIDKSLPIYKVLDREIIDLNNDLAQKFVNGLKMDLEKSPGQYWVKTDNFYLGLGSIESGVLKSDIGFSRKS